MKELVQIEIIIERERERERQINCDHKNNMRFIKFHFACAAIILQINYLLCETKKLLCKLSFSYANLSYDFREKFNMLGNNVKVILF